MNVQSVKIEITVQRKIKKHIRTEWKQANIVVFAENIQSTKKQNKILMHVRGEKMLNDENESKNKNDKAKPEDDLKNKREKKKKSSNIFKDMANEYKKIVWPSFGDLCKQTVNVIFVCLFFGVIIFGIDAGFGYFMNYVTNILSK